LGIGADGGEGGEDGRRSMIASPGTVDEMHFGMDEDEEESHSLGMRRRRR